MNPGDPAGAGWVARLGLALVCAGAALGWAYGLNAIADRGMDASREKNPLAGMIVVPPSALRVVGASGVVATLAGAALGSLALSLTLVSLVAGGAYSLGPRMKARPLVGLGFNTFIFVPLVGLLASRGVALPAHFPVLFLVFVVMLLQNQLLHELGDWDEDTRAGLCTTAVFLGRKATRGVAAVLVLPSVFGAAHLAAPPVLIAGASLALAGSTAPLWLTRSPPSARALHRRLCLALGGLLLALSWLSERVG